MILVDVNCNNTICFFSKINNAKIRFIRLVKLLKIRPLINSVEKWLADYKNKRKCYFTRTVGLMASSMHKLPIRVLRKAERCAPLLSAAPKSRAMARM